METNASQSGYALVNGLKLYHEIHGAGEPLILLHGGVGGSAMFGSNLTTLSRQTHYNIGSSPMLATVVTPFLDAPIH